MQFKAILFDLDGTLLDTSALIIQSFQYTIRKHCRREVDSDFVRAHFGRPLRSTLAVLFPEAAEEMVKTYHAYMLQHLDRMTKTFSGVAENVGKLYDQGIQLAVVTSKLRTVAIRSLQIGGLDKYFSLIVGFEQTIRHKPYPDPAAYAVAALALPPGECLLVGDSPFDILCGREAGCKTAAVRWTEVSWQAVLNAGPDYIIHTPEELPVIADLKAKTG